MAGGTRVRGGGDSGAGPGRALGGAPGRPAGTVRDSGSKGMSILQLRDFIRRGELEGPDILAAGMPLTITGGHCNFCGLECDSREEAVKAVRLLCKQGVDYIKVMVSGGNMTPGSDSLIDQYDLIITLAEFLYQGQSGKTAADDYDPLLFGLGYI